MHTNLLMPIFPLKISNWVDGKETDRIVGQFKEIGMLRGDGIIYQKFSDNLAVGGIKSMPRVCTADSPPPRNHLTSVWVVSNQFNYAFH